MMAPIRFAFLFAVVIFSAFTVHEAGKNVRINQANQRKLAKLRSALTTDNVRFMNRAIELKKNSRGENDSDRNGSVVVNSKGDVSGEGWDRMSELHDPSAHAVLQAVRQACERSNTSKLFGSTIYTATYPCDMCISLIQQVGIEKVYYYTEAALKTIRHIEPVGDASTITSNRPLEIVPIGPSQMVRSEVVSDR
jgi:tRNA(Arg) A34 adenosine deaminase TadA